MPVFFDPFRSLTNEPFGQQFGSALAAGGSTGIPGLLSLWNAKTPAICPVGPQIQTSAAGNQPDADGNMVPWPVNHPGKGVMVQPAYSNLLQNSKFEGAVSGSPGTAATNWAMGGVISAPYTLTVVPQTVGNKLTFTTSASRLYIFQYITITVGATLTFNMSCECDGVEKIGDFLSTENVGSTITYFIDDASATVNSVPTAATHMIRVMIAGGSNNQVLTKIGSGVSAAATGTVTIYNPQWQLGAYQMPYAASGAGATTSVTSTAATSSNNGLAIPLNAAMTAALSRGAFTAAALVEMGVSSTQVTVPANILSANDVAAGLIFADSGGKLKCTDGTNTAEVTVTGGWARTDELLPVVQCDGATFRIGYAKNTFTAITWGDAVAVGADGDWNVVTHERIGLNSVIPFGVQQVQTWNKAASEAEVLKVRGYAL